MAKKNILFICGSKNQTTMLHQISKYLDDYNHFYSAFYSDGIERFFARLGLLDFSVLGGNFKKQTETYFRQHDLKIDYEGRNDNYDLIVICSDLIVPKKLLNKKMVMVQEGMTDPEIFFYHLVKKLKIPRYFGGTAATGLSNAFTYFCVASEGYRDLFIRKGVKPEKLLVTGIPNFDNCIQYVNNDFPYKNYALVCSSDSRETFKFENRKKFIHDAVKLSEGKQMIFKLHPNENVPRAEREIRKYAPEGSLVFSYGNTNEMIANCDILITMYSTVVYVGLALGKKVYSAFDLEELKRLLPDQNGGESARNIARVCQSLMENEPSAVNEFQTEESGSNEGLRYRTA
ncbi:MAG: hypothetical protein JNJ56_00845 [Ignavibacteria bacterium]|nr:hypothetical protein [Ignavibacteria bacterium]